MTIALILHEVDKNRLIYRNHLKYSTILDPLARQIADP